MVVVVGAMTDNQKYITQVAADYVNDSSPLIPTVLSSLYRVEARYEEIPHQGIRGTLTVTAIQSWNVKWVFSPGTKS